MKNTYYKKFTSQGLSLFELVLTITISSIVFTITMMFINSAVNVTGQLSLSQGHNNSIRVVLNMLTEDFMNNDGNINIVKNNDINTLTLNFNIIDPYDDSISIPVQYIYDANYYQLYKKSSNENSILLLDNLTNCDFITNVATNVTNVTLIVNMLFEQNNIASNIYEVINAPYINGQI